MGLKAKFIHAFLRLGGKNVGYLAGWGLYDDVLRVFGFPIHPML